MVLGRSIGARVALVVAMSAGLALAGCSSSGSGAKTTPTAGTTAPAATKTAVKATVAVTLKEFSVTPAQTSVAAGEITFAVQNAGAIPHEFVVVKSDLAPDALPQVNQKVVDVAKVQVVAETEPFDSGKKQELTAELQPGRYVLLCNVASHYISGMYTAFTVTETR